MIRIDYSNSGISTILNEFHATSAQTSGFRTNATSGSKPPTTLTTYVGVASQSPPSSIDGYDYCIYRSLGTLPFNVTAGYLNILRASGGYSITKESGYSTNVVKNLPAVDYSIATNLPTGGSTYLRWLDQGPDGIVYTWYRSASGTSVRDILAIGPGLTLDTTIAPDCVRGTAGNFVVFDVVTFTYDSTNLSIKYEIDSTGVYFLAFDGSYGAWSGSSLGNGAFRVKFFHLRTNL